MALQNRKKPHNMQSTHSSAANPKKKNINLKAFIWLVLFFPAGITLMWRNACTWPKGVKFAVSGIVAAAMITIFILPAPTSNLSGGITLVGARPEVEVYGPELPSAIVTGYTRQNTDSIIVTDAQNDVHYVYAADGASCYHEYECKFAYASSQRLTVYEAYFLGFEPCGLCKPPEYQK